MANNLLPDICRATLMKQQPQNNVMHRLMIVHANTIQGRADIVSFRFLFNPKTIVTKEQGKYVNLSNVTSVHFGN